MKEATFSKDGKTIKATAINSAGMGFLSNLVCSGWYTAEEQYDICLEYAGKYVTIETVA